MNVDERAAKIRLVVLDVDGVLTDGVLAYTAEGETLKRFHVHDGTGIQLLLQSGIDVVLVSARASAPLERRARELGIGSIHSRDKLAAVERLTTERGIDLDHVCFVGDDVVDVPAMRQVGLAVAVANAHPTAQTVAQLVTQREGGRGAVREVADRILEARKDLDAAHERFVTNTSSSFGVIIPARYASTRLPGKPLRELAGRPMVLHVLDNARQAGAAFVVVATDDERIARVVRDAGGEAVMTSPHHESGTDRLAEAVERLDLADDGVIVNVQGDEPLMDPSLIRRVATALLTRPDAGVATAATPIRTVIELMNPSVVKAIVNESGTAVTFSRAPIPWVRDVFALDEMPVTLPETTTFLRHLGIYAYRVSALRRIASHPPVALERAEALEQLRMLWLGIPVHVCMTDEAVALGVDTESDLEAAENLVRSRLTQFTGTAK